MNPRILKKLCKRAAPILEKRFHISVERSGERDDYPVNIRGWPRHQLNWYGQSANGRTLADTPYVWWLSSVEDGEYDHTPAYPYLLNLAADVYSIFDKTKAGTEECPFIGPKIANPSALFTMLTRPEPKVDW